MALRVVDHPPGYLALPTWLRRKRTLTTAQSALLSALAREAITAREAGDRRYLQRFEREASRRLGSV